MAQISNKNDHENFKSTFFIFQQSFGQIDVYVESASILFLWIDATVQWSKIRKML